MTDLGKADYISNSADPKNIQDLTTYTLARSNRLKTFPKLKDKELIVKSSVQNLLQQMTDKFQGMSDTIITRIDDMGHRIDDLEKNIADLMTQAGVEEK